MTERMTIANMEMTMLWEEEGLVCVFCSELTAALHFGSCCLIP
jgi:hypothetical protein